MFVSKKLVILECVSPICWVKTNILKNPIIEKSDGSEITVRDLTQEQKDVVMARLKENSKTVGDCLFSTLFSDEKGYCHTTFLGRSRGVHCISYEIHNNAQIPEDLEVLHKCNNPPCFEAKHLKLGTPEENSEDMIRDGTKLCGENHPKAKYSDEEKNEIIYQSKGKTPMQVYKNFKKQGKTYQ